MPEVQEVFRMATQKVRPDPGAMERQFRGQRRRSTRRKAGVYGLVAAIVIGATLVAASMIPKDEPRRAGTRPSTVNPVDVATGFVEAYGALDADEVITYLADDADVSSLIEWVGAQGGEGPLEEFRLLFSLLEAQGYKHTLDSCEERGSSASVTTLHCTYDFHSLRSDEIGRGPFSGSYFDLIVRDGEIAHASGHLEYLDEFSPQVWEPFTDWVYKTYPEDAAVMYEVPRTLERLTEESIRLWERHTRGYVREVGRAQGQ